MHLHRSARPVHLIIGVIVLLCMGTALQAQRPGTAPPNGRILGRIIDGATNGGAEFATVAVKALPKDSIVGGDMAKTNGDFVVEKLRPGRYNVVVSFIGYIPLEREVQLTREQPELDMGNLRLEPDAKVLDEATVVGEKARMQLQVDRRVYNVDKDIASRGGTATDVMKNIPGLGVDVDGNVTLRTGSPQILVDGRPSLLQLDQIPAEEIDRVEVITNPGVAFDASSTGGIVNVVMKKSTKPGYSGQLQANVGTNGRLGGGGNLQVKEGRTTINASLNSFLSNNRTDQATERQDRLNGEPVAGFDQTGESESLRRMLGGRLSIDQALTNRNTLTVGGGFHQRLFGTVDEQLFTNSDGLGATISSGTQRNDQDNGGYNVSANMAFRRKSPKPGKEWTTDLTWNLSDRASDSYFDRSSYDALGALTAESPVLQHNLGGTEGQQWTWQFDAQNPINDSVRFEYGLKSSVKQEDNYLDVFFRDNTTNIEVPDTLLSSTQRVTDIINAIYFNYQRRLSAHWTLQTGLRVEQTWFEATRNGSPSVSIRYPDGTDNILNALFPAIYASRKWDNNRELQVNLSRKINRPRHWQVMPFIMFGDSRSYRIGNPSLGPELVEIGEVNHLLPFGERSSWLTSVFAKHTGNIITNFVYTSPSDSSILISTFVNGADSWTYGWENTIKYEPLKGMQFTVSGTAQWLEVGLKDNSFANSGWFFTGNAAINQKLPGQWGVQINGEYEGERPIAQGVQLEQWGIDASVSKDFGKKLSMSLALNDVFFTRRWGTRYETPDLTQETWRRREQRFLRFGITWRFGQQDVSVFRRSKQQRAEPGSGGGEGGDF